jgi:hypothetical protein
VRRLVLRESAVERHRANAVEALVELLQSGVLVGVGEAVQRVAVREGAVLQQISPTRLVREVVMLHDLPVGDAAVLRDELARLAEELHQLRHVVRGELGGLPNGNVSDRRHAAISCSVIEYVSLRTRRGVRAQSVPLLLIS